MNLTASFFHGGPDALGVPPHDFSTNANAVGPCPPALQALNGADLARYPDPGGTRVRQALAVFHGVDPSRVLLLASASEGIQRLSAWAARTPDASVWLPPTHYGDCARAATAHGLRRTADAAVARLVWACEPSTPFGRSEAGLRERVQGLGRDQCLVLDRAYEPLRLGGAPTVTGPMPDAVWQLMSPNKALGLTGVRGAYAIAPAHAADAVRALEAMGPSWPLGAHAEAMLLSWTSAAVQQWLQTSLTRLREWRDRQQRVCESLGWVVQPGDANFMTVAPRVPVPQARLAALRQDHGVKLRDCASFGLPGILRLGVLSPAAQDALAQGWRATSGGEEGGG